jgi:hypothetical protein
MSAAGSLQLVKNAGTEDVFTFEDGDTSPASAAEWGQIRNGQIELENWNQADVADRVLATNPIRSRVGEGFTNEYLTKAIDNAETFMREKAYPPLGPRPSGEFTEWNLFTHLMKNIPIMVVTATAFELAKAADTAAEITDHIRHMLQHCGGLSQRLRHQLKIIRMLHR